MRRRSDRYAMDLHVELYAGGEPRRVPLADLSRSGMFLRVAPALPVGELVHVAMFFEGRQLATPARVVHGLGEADARVLGRRPGTRMRCSCAPSSACSRGASARSRTSRCASWSLTAPPVSSRGSRPS